MLSQLKELDLCGLSSTEQWSRSGFHSVKKKVRTSPACLAVRALQSCQGVCHYSWVVRVIFSFCVYNLLCLSLLSVWAGVKKTYILHNFRWPLLFQTLIINVKTNAKLPVFQQSSKWSTEKPIWQWTWLP